jgi:hypothetical protein
MLPTIHDAMRLKKKQYVVLKETYDEDYLPFDYGLLEIVTRKIRSRKPPYLELRELKQTDRWKNGSRNSNRIEKNNENAVEKFTKDALSAADKEVKRSIDILEELEGVGIPVASAILYFALPEKFVVIDRYTWNAYTKINGANPVDWEKPFTGGPKEYEEFWTFCRNKAARLGCGWNPRNVEKALFTYGENQGKI